MGTLEVIPDELLRQICFLLPPEDCLSLQFLSRRFYRLANDTLLWRHHCQAFRFWDVRHRIHEKYAQPLNDVQWKALWRERKEQNLLAAKLLDGIIYTSVGRLGRAETICSMGPDVKDFLLEQSHVEPSADDFLARRWQANALLDSINKAAALEVWSRIRDLQSPNEDLDVALGAFDMFVLHDQPQDLDWIRQHLDTLAAQFRESDPAFEGRSIREKALSITRWLKKINLGGLNRTPNAYRNLRNCLIGHALSEEPHCSLPVVSSSIFISIATRLGLTLACVAIPIHVYAAVYAPPGQTLDGDTLPADQTKRDVMYLDPFSCSDEIPVEELRRIISIFRMGQNADELLEPMSVPAIVLRVARNIGASYKASRPSEAAVADPGLKALRAGHPDFNMEMALWSSMWAEVMLNPIDAPEWSHGLGHFLSKFVFYYPYDLWSVKKYLIPLYETFVRRGIRPVVQNQWQDPRQIVRMTVNMDGRPTIFQRRWTRDIQEQVSYRVGQVFRHKRYGYIGILNGWSTPKTELIPGVVDWPRPREADRGSPDTKSKPHNVFYSCVIGESDKVLQDRIRVSQENVEIVTDPSLVTEQLMFAAGKFFRRFDPARCEFVSNIKEMYPDD